MDRSTAKFKKGDAGQRRLDERILELEDKRFAIESAKFTADWEDKHRASDKEWKERKKKRESHDRLKLGKFKLMMYMIRSERDRM